jgi:hypothetical protein
MILADVPGKTPTSLLLVSQLVMFWTLANYAVTADPVQQTKNAISDKQPAPRFWAANVVLRSLLLGAITLLIAGFSSHSFFLALVLVAGALLLPISRRWWVVPRYGAELEIGINLFFVVAIVVSVQRWHLTIVHGWASLPFAEGRASSLYLITAIVVFNLRGATYVVRGILNKCGALPELTLPKNTTFPARELNLKEAGVDATEFNRGRWIGNLERILLLAIVSQAGYSAVAFLMAAKGFIRSKDLENREWAEYFLLGTLASMAVALVGGIAIGKIIGAFW